MKTSITSNDYLRTLNYFHNWNQYNWFHYYYQELNTIPFSFSGKGETRLSDVKFEDMETLFRINAAGPLMMAKYFAPLMIKGEGSVGAGGHKAILANITARAGSLEDNKLGGWYGYRMAKCALNMANK